MLQHFLQHPQFSQADDNRPDGLSPHVWQLPVHDKKVEVAILSKELIIRQP